MILFIGAVIFLIFASFFIYFLVATMLEHQVNGRKIMMIGLHISILGLALTLQDFGFLSEYALAIVMMGLITSVITMTLDPK